MAVSFNLQVVGESLGVGDGIDTTFYTDLSPVLTGSETIWSRVGDTTTEVTSGYTLTVSTGLVTFDVAPVDGAVLTINYTWNIGFEIYPDDVTFETKAKRKIYPIPNAHSIIVPLGEEGPLMRVQANIDEIERAKIVLFPAQNIVKVTVSTYDEFVVGDEFMLDSNKVNRKGGYIDRWRIMMVLIRKWA